MARRPQTYVVAAEAFVSSERHAGGGGEDGDGFVRCYGDDIQCGAVLRFVKFPTTRTQSTCKRRPQNNRVQSISRRRPAVRAKGTKCEKRRLTH